MPLSRHFAVTILAAIALLSGAAHARNCVTMGFSVNDYGKEGPTRDAQNLLDRHIEKSMGEKGITGYKVGTKNTTCKLFLDFIVFDEHTCTAVADVCWGKGPVTTKLTMDQFRALPVSSAPASRKPAAVTASVKPAAQ